jgi:peptidoglycan/xylan/chitin deacetylase (PgdA/CDA1 family)
MEDLSRRGYRTVSLDEYAATLDGRSLGFKSVLLTFDDAYAHVDEVVSPVLRRHGFRAAMFVSLGQLGGRNTWDAAHFPRLATLEIASAGQIRDLDPSVWDLASHGLRHVDLRTVGEGLRRIELVEAREGLSELIGRPLLDLAYPHGASDAAVRRDAEFAGYRMAFAAGWVVGTNRFQLSRRRVRGDDSLSVFRMKTSAWSAPLYGAYGLAPGWARATARLAVRTAQRYRCLPDAMRVAWNSESIVVACEVAPSVNDGGSNQTRVADAPQRMPRA